MPTADDYRNAAVALRTARAQADDVELTANTVGESHGLAGGSVSELVGQAMSAALVMSQHLQSQCDWLAEECMDRAAACDAYAAAMRRYEFASDQWWGRKLAYEASLTGGPPAPEPRSAPVMPGRPQPWIELG